MCERTQKRVKEGHVEEASGKTVCVCVSKDGAFGVLPRFEI